jgi:predicted ATPase
VTEFLHNAFTAQPLVLHLDDLHWADEPSLLLLQHLAQRTARDRLLMLGTYRDVELDRTHPLSEVTARSVTLASGACVSRRRDFECHKCRITRN